MFEDTMMLRAQNERSIALEAFMVMQPYARLEEHHASNFEAKISISMIMALSQFRKNNTIICC